MKKKFLILCLVCLLCLSSCRVADDETITGDVKNDEMAESVDAPEKTKHSKADISEKEQKTKNEMTSTENAKTIIEKANGKSDAVDGNDSIRFYQRLHK